MIQRVSKVGCHLIDGKKGQSVDKLIDKKMNAF
jgi:hypothetical protein